MNIFRCPRCGKGKLFKGWLTLADSCDACGLSLAEREVGDGPAIFSIFIIGALAAIGAALVEIKYQPPYWLHAAIWIPFIIVGSLASLRILKAALIHAQFRVRGEDFR